MATLIVLFVIITIIYVWHNHILYVYLHFHGPSVDYTELDDRYLFEKCYAKFNWQLMQKKNIPTYHTITTGKVGKQHGIIFLIGNKFLFAFSIYLIK